MPSQTLSLNSNTATNADFRAWGKGISDALAAVGLVKVASTGQIDWATVAAPTATLFAAGFEVWAFSDSLQATAPIFLKIEYGTGGTLNSPQLWVTVGTAHDGAGTLSSAPGTGTSVAPRVAVGITGSALTVMTGSVVVSSPDASCVGVLLWPGYQNGWGGAFFAVERSRDPDGTPNGRAYSLVTATSGTTSGSAAWVHRMMTGAANPGSWALCPGIPDASFVTTIIGTTLYPYPVFTMNQPRLGGASKLLVAIGRGDVPARDTFTMTHYGAARTWVSAGYGSTSGSGWGGWTQGGSTNNGLNSFAMRVA